MVITGASSGIGLCTALLFARRGWRLGLIARGSAGLADAYDRVSALGAMATSVVADVADAAALDAAATAIEAALGPIAVWINCAGNGVYGRFVDVPAAEFQRVTDVTYMGVVNGTRSALLRMLPRDRGTIVNVCSAIAYHGLPALSSYAGAKYAVRGFTLSVRAELAHERSTVRLATVYPPAVNTPFFSHAPSHLPRRPRPARPVYQPEIVAEGIYLAATTRRHEVNIAGITSLFAFGAKIAPALITYLVGRLGYAGQMTDSVEAGRRYAPAMFAPPPHAPGPHGPFGAEARGYSIQLWLQRRRRGVAMAALSLIALAAATLLH